MGSQDRLHRGPCGTQFHPLAVKPDALRIINLMAPSGVEVSTFLGLPVLICPSPTPPGRQVRRRVLPRRVPGFPGRFYSRSKSRRTCHPLLSKFRPPAEDGPVYAMVIQSNWLFFWENSVGREEVKSLIFSGGPAKFRCGPDVAISRARCRSASANLGDHRLDEKGRPRCGRSVAGFEQGVRASFEFSGLPFGCSSPKSLAHRR